MEGPIDRHLGTPYRRRVWEKSMEILEKVSSVIDIDGAVVLGSFTTEKERPADVDFIVMVRTKDEEEDWSTDMQFVPNNAQGRSVVEDARRWMEEKYGEGNYEVLELDSVRQKTWEKK